MSREVRIHHLEHAGIALTLAQGRNISIVLNTPPQALAYASVDYFREVFCTAQSKYPEAQAKYILDCSGYPGMAMLALRRGIQHMRYIDDQTYMQSLLSMAQQKGTTLLTNPPETLFDLLDQEENQEELYSWLTFDIASKSCSVL